MLRNRFRMPRRGFSCTRFRYERTMGTIMSNATTQHRGTTTEYCHRRNRGSLQKKILTMPATPNIVLYALVNTDTRPARAESKKARNAGIRRKSAVSSTFFSNLVSRIKLYTIMVRENRNTDNKPVATQ